MFRMRAVQTPSLIEAVLVTLVIIIILNTSIVFLEASPHVPLLLSILFLLLYGRSKKIPYKTLETGVTEGAKVGITATLLFFFIGMLISAWMVGGTIPTLIYYGFALVTEKYFLAIVFVVCGVIGMSIGSSLTTVGTIGVAFISIASAVDVSLAMTAGAIVSGAFFGDKMSPLSDTTNMAASILDVDLFAHIKNMMWTTIPAFIISFVLFAIMSPVLSAANFTEMIALQEGIYDTGLVHPLAAIIPVGVLIVLSLRKTPALLALAAGTASALICMVFIDIRSLGDVVGILFNGYTSTTGVEQIDELLSRGGMASMLSTIGIVLLALSLGGLLFTLGIVPRLLQSIEQSLRKVSSVIFASACTAIGINVLIGEQYVSILLTGESYASAYKKVGLANINLARVAEDAGTVVNPLVPWSVCGVFITTVIGVPTLSYLPFAFFCLLSPIFSILAGLTKKSLTFTSSHT